MKIRVLVLVILAISIAPSTAIADPPITLPEDIYQRIAMVERIPPAQRNNAQRVQLGRDYRSTGRLEDALVQAQAALAKQPDDGDALLLRGDLQFQRAEYQQALATFNRVAQLRPGQANVQLRRSQVLSAMGKSREAEAANGLYVNLRDRQSVSPQR
ncbi:tetratricopeptide repeat protein [Pseudoxanthomonas sacheonensis]|uniref:Flp pilus assembly protein TadD n=1 Tax=Pseudoxanthomonas sacheonensis TaxID=443615 RepID=A0ABU1RR06_9GAMM|nr:tetratricopeptide repeat protein [Pseudoxanthomonas sacheonensis]MDR6841214.1 Flp pilus assembly protein TadD [Pseudoxanthomonas sacheonensis]